jgi:phage terminase small subunit
MPNVPIIPKRLREIAESIEKEPKNGYKLTPRQKGFAQEYVIDRNGTQAAIRAGYSKNSANEYAVHLLANISIKAEIDRLLQIREQRTQISADYVLESLKEVAERCKQAVPVLDKDSKPTGEYRFDSAGVNKALELLGKHLKMFTDRLEIRVIHSLDDLSEEERESLLRDIQARMGAVEAETVPMIEESL